MHRICWGVDETRSILQRQVRQWGEAVLHTDERPRLVTNSQHYAVEATERRLSHNKWLPTFTVQPRSLSDEHSLLVSLVYMAQGAVYDTIKKKS